MVNFTEWVDDMNQHGQTESSLEKQIDDSVQKIKKPLNQNRVQGINSIYNWVMDQHTSWKFNYKYNSDRISVLSKQNVAKWLMNIIQNKEYNLIDKINLNKLHNLYKESKKQRL